MISRLGELTALPAYRLISSYATLAMLSLEHSGVPDFGRPVEVERAGFLPTTEQT